MHFEVYTNGPNLNRVEISHRYQRTLFVTPLLFIGRISNLRMKKYQFRISRHVTSRSCRTSATHNVGAHSLANQGLVVPVPILTFASFVEGANDVEHGARLTSFILGYLPTSIAAEE
jgi:hypothetical protein